jgi:solute carrier family 8 (sodium/calcium exchanger)
MRRSLGRPQSLLLLPVLLASMISHTAASADSGDLCIEKMTSSAGQANKGKCVNTGPDYLVGKCKIMQDTDCSTFANGSYEYEKCLREKGRCGKVHIMEFEAGNMVLEYNVDANVCGGGMLLPFIPGEMIWGRVGHTCIYLVMLIFSFLGVAIIADVFMAAIEVITSKERTVSYQVTDEETGAVVTRTKTFLVWNATVANLSLMALGSSAPEILLSVIETLGTLEQPVNPGGLGPGTIVGSAAFNLLVIIAICVMAIGTPGNEDTRRIDDIGVFSTTAFYSVFAYVWLFICVQDNCIQLWEGVATFLLFPLLVAQCYATDRCHKRKTEQHPTGMQQMMRGMQHGMGDHTLKKIIVGTEAVKVARCLNKADDETIKEQYSHKAEERRMSLGMQEVPGDEKAAAEMEIVDLAYQELMKGQKVSPMKAKINARRQLAGRQRVVQHKMEKSSHLAAIERRGSIVEEAEMEEKMVMAQGPQTTDAVVSFSTSEYAAEENKGRIELQVVRSNKLDSRVVVSYSTSDGSALSGEDYIHAFGEMTFEPGEATKAVSIVLIDDSKYEPDENFFVTLRKPKPGRKDNETDPYEFGAHEIACVTILNDDEPGHFGFAHTVCSCQESDGLVEVQVVRSHGCDGDVTIRYETRDGSARAGSEYEARAGELAFVSGETMKTIKVLLIDDEDYAKSKQFSIELEIDGYPACGAEYATLEVNGQSVSAASTVVNVVGDEDHAKVIESVAALMRLKMEKMSVGTASWTQQLDEALSIEGEEGKVGPSNMDYIMHFLTFGWKVIFAIVPPTCYCGGWLTFGVALGFIGLLTAFVADIASIFGCLVGLEDSITAITFVALGTSLPDTFASKTAATNDDTADASIGNVTGSNSVNVFLGLGLPWLIASVAHQSVDYAPPPVTVDGVLITFPRGSYPVLAGDLGFSVVLFCIAALLCIGTLYLRRYTVGAELGGPTFTKNLTGAFFIFLWLVYVIVSALQVKGQIISFL